MNSLWLLLIIPLSAYIGFIVGAVYVNKRVKDEIYRNFGNLL